MNNKIVVIAVSVDANYITLYDVNGATTALPQCDPRITHIMAAVKGPLSEVPPRAVEVSLEMPKPDVTNPEFAEAEKASGGLVRFFKVAKSKIANWFNADDLVEEAPKPSLPVPPQNLGVVPGTYVADVEPEAEPLAPGKYDVLLHSFPPDGRVAIIKALRVACGIGLKEAHDLAGASKPVIIAAGVAAPDASRIIDELMDEGAKVSAVLTPAGKPEPEEVTPAPVVPVAAEKVALVKKAQTNDEKVAEANARLDMLEKDGVKASDPKFKEALKEDETVVAVTNGGRTIIPEAQHLQSQLRAANELKDYTGFQKFLDRLGTVVPKRRFSVEDLMTFMKHGDLPIADDGCLVIYKRLTRKGKDAAGRELYVDVHSRKVIQRVGSRVFMDESLVDPDRRQDCSNGLHVAALSYLGSFSGEITIVGKVAPEDVIAVPQYNNNKMRVSGYDIIAVLDEDQATFVNRGGKLSDVKGGKELLNAILRGKHIAIDQTVQIGASNGGKLTITDLDVEQAPIAPLTKEDVRNTNLDVIPDPKDIPAVPSAPVAPADLKPVAPAKPEQNSGKAKGEAVKKESKAETAQRLWAEYQTDPSTLRLEALVAFKKAAKKGWSVLGISDAAVELIESEAAKLPKEKTKSKTVSDFSDLQAKTTKSGTAKPGTYKARMAAILGTSLNETNAREALALKKEAKKGWAVLGVSDEVVAAIEALTK